MGTTRRVLLGLAAIAVAAGGCAAVAFAPNELERAASEAKGYPFVLDAYYVEDGWWPGESYLEVIVADSTTQEQVTTLWCEVIEPHGGHASNTIVETMDSREVPDTGCSGR